MLARRERVERATGPRLLERGVGRDLDERGVAPGDDRHAFPAGEADREPSPLVRDASGMRTGRIDRVLAGDFDLLGDAAPD